MEEVKGTCINIVTEILNQEEVIKKSIRRKMAKGSEFLEKGSKVISIYRKYCVVKLLKLEEKRKLELECSKLLTKRIKV